MCGGKGAVTESLPPSGCGTEICRARQMQAFLHAAGKLPVLVVIVIFGITKDRVAQMQAVNTQLVGASGVGLKLKPAQVLSRLLDDPVVGNRVIGAGLSMLGDAHPVAILGGFLDQPGGYLAFHGRAVRR
jgi:hypothetical protein